MSKFKVGDRVRATRNIYDRDGIKKGQTGVVKRVNDFAVFVYPDVLNTELSDTTWCFFTDQLELVENQPTREYSCIRVVPPSKPKREIVEGVVEFDSGAILTINNGGDNDVILGVRASFFTSKALREAVALFTTLAEVLEENENA